MTSRESATRRVWLGSLAAALGVTSGCGTRTETGRNDGTTPATTQTSAPTEATAPSTATETTRRTQTPGTETDTPTRDTETDTPTRDTETDTPTRDTETDTPTRDTETDTPTRDTETDTPTRDTETDTPTPDTETDTSTPDTETDTPTPALNQTGYEVTRLLGPEDDRHGVFHGSLLHPYDENVRVQLLTSQEEWKTARREIEDRVDTSYEGLPFVTETAFHVESLVVVWVDMGDTDRVRLVDVTREGTRTVRLRVKAVGSFGAQVRMGRILLVRVPNGQRLTRAVVKYTNDDEGELTVVTDERGDESGTETATQDTDRQRVWPIHD